MASFATASKTIVIRTSRDTLGLVVAATAMTFAIAYAVHSRHESQLAQPVATAAAPFVAQDASPREAWAGHLAEVTPAAAPTPAEPMTSASLTVPKKALALPVVAKSPAKPRPCAEPQPCAPKVIAAASSPAATHRAAVAAERAEAARERRSLVGLLNPLNHLPDMSTVSRPFTYAGGTVAGWFKRL